MDLVVDLKDPQASERSAVGGKGANLGRLVAAEFPVPHGFVVSTAAYRAFTGVPEVADRLWPLVDSIEYGDAAAVESKTAEIRSLIASVDVPADLRSSIVAAYEGLMKGSEGYVAVRSSGTAEDTAEASFAGLHDTYLDIRGADAVVDAVKRCWASLWTARATSYRHDKDFDHREATLAVVVQRMVEADAAGVAFTANPMTGGTREIVINSSWGLGEAVVSGVVTPDQFVVSSDTLEIRDRTTGAKEKEIVRDPDSGSGTLERETEADRRAQLSLDDEGARALARLALRVQEHYDSMPQDIEWACEGDELFLLQSRDVTGVELSWDEDLDRWQTLPDDPEFVWTRAYADEYLTGAITPLFYSIRTREFTACHVAAMKVWGFHDLANMRIWKYRQGEAYFNSTMDREFNIRTLPKFLRSPGVLRMTPSTWWDEIMEAPFSWFEYLKVHARILGLEPTMGPTKWIDLVYEWIDTDRDRKIFFEPQQLKGFSDEELERLNHHQVKVFQEFLTFFWGGFFIYAPIELMLLGDLIGRWYDGDNDQVFTDLIAGMPKQTLTLKENGELWELANLIRDSEELQSVFDEFTGADFFAEVGRRDSTKEFADRYAKFIVEHGHRGHADRDFWFTRRAEAPEQDYSALRTILTGGGEGPSPLEQEERMRGAREAATEDLFENVGKKFLGGIKVEALKFLLKHTHAFLLVRDDERWIIDRLTWAKKLALLEVGRRLFERGLIEREDDFYFLSLEENWELLKGGANERLFNAKIKGRRHHFDRFANREVVPPKYIVGGQPTELDIEAEGAEDGSLVGMGTSRGQVTGKARVLHSMTEIGTIEKGDILICNSTDPGWTPVFLSIGGLVLETGGMLAHGSCLSREYGLPAVQIANATKLIPDGALITVNGETGAVTIEQEQRQLEEAAA